MSTKREMLVDYATDGQRIERDIAFSRDYLLQLANAHGLGTAVPLAGSATGANEAVIQTFLRPGDKLLVYSNGVFGDRLAAICAAMGISHQLIRSAPTEPLSVMQLSAALLSDSQITHVMVVHCETSSGIINPIQEIADLCRDHGKKLLIDAVSSFGVLDIDMRVLGFEALTLGVNKGLQGPPGLAWVIANEASLRACKGNARSLTLDLWDQWQYLERHKNFRFTPPTHVVAATTQALREHQAEGQKARFGRYARNRARLVDGMREFGFETLLPLEIATPIVATFLAPNDPQFDPVRFSHGLAQQGFQISLRRAAVPNTLRIGCMGDLDETDMAAAVAAVGRVLREMRAPAPHRSSPQPPDVHMSR
jgi:2-aminoethylphosphonate-pyruvate transaminase